MAHEAYERDEFRTPFSPEGLRVFQITGDSDRGNDSGMQNTCRWTPDSRKFVFWRHATATGAKAGCWLCDAEDGFAIHPIVEWDAPVQEWAGEVAQNTNCWPSRMDNGKGETLDTRLIPDGSGIYHLRHVHDKLELRSLDLDGSNARMLATVPAPLRRGPATISSDGRRYAVNVFLGDGKVEGAPWATRVIDVPTGKTWDVVLSNQCRLGARYRPVTEPRGVYDLVAYIGPSRLSDGSWVTPPDGRWRRDAGLLLVEAVDSTGSLGHWCVIKDDGSEQHPSAGTDAKYRMIPVPRRPLHALSHAAWRGRQAESLVASMYHHPPGAWRAPFVEAWIAEMTGEDVRADRNPADGRWVDLTRFVSRADACHFDFDESGEHLVSDTDGYSLPQTSQMYVATYVQPRFDSDPYLKTRYLLMPRTSWKGQPSHPHPYLSPDGRFVVFQSDFSGRPQVNVAYGFEYP